MKLNKYSTSLLITTLLLVIIGLLCIYSASNIIALDRYNNPYYFVVRQGLFVGLGLGAMFFLSRFPYEAFKQYATLIFLACVALLIIVLIPGIGVVRGGARSWLGIGSFGVQPSEFVKIAVVIIVAKFIANFYDEISKLTNLIYLAVVILLVFGLIMLQPDFGTGMVIILTTLILLFISGLPLKYFFYMIGVGVIGIIGLVISAPYRLQRIFAFLDPWSDPLGAGFQIIQSLYAIAPGGLFGVGFNNSIQKNFYLPEPQTDFIFAIVLEELGFIGGGFIILLYIYFIYLCLRISFLKDDLFGKFLCLGLSSMVFVQFVINISVVIGIIPVTGITLPFLSYGGSSILVTLTSVGIILNIGRNLENEVN